MIRDIKFLGAVMIAGLLGQGTALADDIQACRVLKKDKAQYSVCTFDPKTADIRLFLKDKDGEVFGHFRALNAELAETGETLAFAMNGGMYHKDRRPVGLYVENGEDIAPISTKPGPGNFHMLPNGIFMLSEYFDEAPEGGIALYRNAWVYTTQDYLDGAHNIKSATQSGPMLVINNELHPRFLKDSESRRIRNGVGQCVDGKTVFVISDTRVNFYDFAALFKDDLKCSYALYLDGTISRLHAPEMGRSDYGLKMGPIIGVVTPAPADRSTD